MTAINIFSAASNVTEAPDLWAKKLPQKWSELSPRLVDGNDGAEWHLGGRPCGAPGFRHPVNGGRYRPTSEELSWLASADGRLWLQSRDDMVGEVLYPNREIWSAIAATEDRDFIVACHQVYNDWMAELVSGAPERIVGIAKIPPTGIKDATEELKRAGEKLKLKGAILDVWPAGVEAEGGLPESDPFWECAAALGIPISIHRPLSILNDEEPPLVAAGGPPPFSYDMNALVYGNVFDRYPSLRVVVKDTGVGWAPSGFEALDETYMRMQGSRTIELGNPDLLPSDYLRRFFWFTVQDDSFGISTRKVLGKAHMMYASFANTFASVWPNSRQLFEQLTGELPNSDREDLASNVVSKLYGVNSATDFTAQEINDYERHVLL